MCNHPRSEISLGQRSTRENHRTHAAVSLISDAQWKHSSVEYEIVFHVRRYSRRAVERALQDNTYSQEREQCHEIITKCRSYARLITHFLPCEVTCINILQSCPCPSRSLALLLVNNYKCQDCFREWKGRVNRPSIIQRRGTKIKAAVREGRRKMPLRDSGGLQF